MIGNRISSESSTRVLEVQVKMLLVRQKRRCLYSFLGKNSTASSTSSIAVGLSSSLLLHSALQSLLFLFVTSKASSSLPPFHPSSAMSFFGTPSGSLFGANPAAAVGISISFIPVLDLWQLYLLIYCFPLAFLKLMVKLIAISSSKYFDLCLNIQCAASDLALR